MARRRATGVRDSQSQHSDVLQDRGKGDLGRSATSPGTSSTATATTGRHRRHRLAEGHLPAVLRGSHRKRGGRECEHDGDLHRSLQRLLDDQSAPQSGKIQNLAGYLPRKNYHQPGGGYIIVPDRQVVKSFPANSGRSDEKAGRTDKLSPVHQKNGRDAGKT